MPEPAQLPFFALLVRTVVEGIQGVLPAQALTDRQIKAIVFAVSAGLVSFYKTDIYSALGFQTSVPSIAPFILSTLILGVSSMGFHDILDYLAGKR